MVFRITAYNKKLNISVIMDSNGKFEKLWQFSLYLRDHGFTVIEVDTSERFLDGNIKPPKIEPEFIVLRACQYGEPQETKYSENGITYRAIKVDKKIYVPNKNITF